MSKAGKVAEFGVLVALAMIFSYVERLIPFNFGLPGAKLGLANIVTVIGLYILGNRGTTSISIVRVVLSGMLFGTLASVLYSLAGAFLSLILMILGKRINKFSIIGISILGGVSHNIGQLMMAIWLVGSVKLAFYGPVLLIAGLLTGILMGFISVLIIDRVDKTRRYSVS